MTHLPAWLRRRRWAVVGGTGLALAAVTPLALPQAASTPPPSDFGVAATTPGEPSGGHAARDTTGGGQPGRKGEPGTAEAPAAEARTAKPVRLSIPRLDVTARIVPVGVNGDGTVAVPPNARQAGWYRHGPAPGAKAGSAVLVGHVDSRTGDLGALAVLYDVRAGDTLVIDRAGAAPAVRYAVRARQVVDKDALPDEAFRRAGPPALTLITCATPYDRDRGGYQNNLLVTATPETAERGTG